MKLIHQLLFLGLGEELFVELMNEVILGEGVCGLEFDLLQPPSIDGVGQAMYGQLEAITVIQYVHGIKQLGDLCHSLLWVHSLSLT